jgi:hypothetical protein
MIMQAGLGCAGNMQKSDLKKESSLKRKFFNLQGFQLSSL